MPCCYFPHRSASVLFHLLLSFLSITILAVVSNGSDHYMSRNSFVSKLMLACPQCIHFKSSNLPDVVPVARFSRGDVNMPNCDVFPINDLVSEVKFEAAVYELLQSDASILASCLLYHRVPIQHVPLRLNVPHDITGRRLFLFEKPEGENNIWYELSSEEKVRSYPFINWLFVLNKLTQSNCYSNLLFSGLFLLRQPIFVHHFSISISCSNSVQIGFFNDSSNKSPSCFPFPLLLHANFALLFLYPKLKQQSETLAT